MEQETLPDHIGPYRVTGRLGRGGMGEVLEGYDDRLDRPVALKRVLHGGRDREQARHRFRREARSVARLSDAAIVQVYDWVEAEGDDWLVMELVGGRHLGDVLAEGLLEPRRSLRIARGVASGLAAAHEAGLVHRDLKPSNVMLLASEDTAADRDRVKILDFGIAKPVALEGGLAASTLTAEGQVIGTLTAMSPEQTLGQPVDHRSDLFALGSLLYEMLSGVSPFAGRGAVETLSRICSFKQTALHDLDPEIPEEVSDFVDRLLLKEPVLRPADARQVTAELDRLSALLSADPEPGPGAGIDALRTPALTAERATILPETLGPQAPRVAPEPAGEDTPHRPLGERRQVTVLCCDLVSSEEGATIAEAPDPETLSEVLPELHGEVAGVVERYGGTLGNTFDHRFTVYFGYPSAHEDDAVRAVRTALELIESRRRTSRRSLALRIGIHTGSAVIAAGPAARDPLLLGSTFDQAVAVQALAAPDEVVLSDAARRLTGRSFELEPLTGAGAASRVAWRVAAALEPQTEAGSRVEVLPMVSRERELELLLSRWRMTEEGRGQVILISGEAGMGKTRLVRAFRDGIPESPHRWWLVYGSPFQRNTPLAPFVGLLRREVLRARPGVDVADQLARLEAFLERYDLPRDDVASLLASLVELPTEGRYPEADLSPENRRTRTLEALVALLLEMADEQPRVLVIEDLHWMDPSTLELLGLVIERAAASPLCVLATSRPRGLPHWEHAAALTRIHLSQLTDEEGAELIGRVASGRSLDPALHQQILARSDGVPLFIEELTRAVLESAGGPETVAVPATLRDSLTARLDRLGSAKAVAQTAAVVGRGFTLEVLAAIGAGGEPELRRELDLLVAAALIHRKGFGANTRYYFKHALIQDVAYDSLLRKDREKLHRRIAEVLIEDFPETRDRQPEIVARHLTEAGDAARAVPFWHRAGQQALAGSAHLEALSHLEHALALFEALPDRSEHAEEELAVLATLANSVTVTRGYAASKEIWIRAYSLCEEIGGTPSFDVLYGLFAFQITHGELAKATSVVEQMLRVAEERDDPVLQLHSRCYSGVCRFYAGRLREALDDLEHASTFDSPEIGPLLIRAYGSDSRTVIGMFEALALWQSGSPDRALERSRRALELADEGAHPFTISSALLLGAFVYLFRREGAEAEKMGASMIELSRKYDMFQDLEGEMVRGFARVVMAAESDRNEDAGDLVRDLSRSLESYHDTGAKVFSTLYVAHLIEACLADGRLERAGELLGQAHGFAETSGERFWKAELHRLSGELAFAGGDPGAARDACLEAARVARDQGAVSLELRALVRLAGLDGGAESRGLLAEVYGRFTEGFDTPDLRRAAQLLGASV